MINIKRYTGAFVSTVLVAAFTAIPASAMLPKTDALAAHSVFIQASHNTPEAEVNYLAEAEITVSEAKSIALEQYPNAEVVDILREGPSYRVRLIRKDGRVVDLFVDAATGRILN